MRDQVFLFCFFAYMCFLAFFVQSDKLMGLYISIHTCNKSKQQNKNKNATKKSGKVLNRKTKCTIPATDQQIWKKSHLHTKKIYCCDLRQIFLWDVIAWRNACMISKYACLWRATMKWWWKLMTADQRSL